MRRILVVLSVLFAGTLAFAEDAAKPPPPRPKVNKIKGEKDKIAYVVTLRPGVPEAGTTFDVELEIYEILPTPDPTYGSRRPIGGAEVRAYLIGSTEPPAKGKKPTSPWVQGHRALRLSDAGTYGFTFTPPTPGVYGLYLRGKTTKVGAIDFSATLPVGIWPIPDGAAPPPLPAPEPAVTAGNLDHGKALCAARCRTDLPGALPKGGTPEFLRSDFAAALDDDALLKAATTEGPALSLLERADLLGYLRSLHWSVTELFPEARAFVAKEFVINEHGRSRIEDAIKVKLDDAEATGVIFVAYKLNGEQPPTAKFIRYDDRVGRDQLSRKNKLGYVVFLSIPKEDKATELALALGKEPVYQIMAISARDAKGKIDEAFAKQLKTFINQGHFNDAKSLKKGAPAIQAKLLPVYFKASELATMYYADERDFTAFDDEFSGEEDVKVEGDKLKLKNK